LGFFVAGLSTTSHTLSTTGFMLAQHPEVQARLQSEMDTLEAEATSEGGAADCPAWEGLKSKRYVTAVITESLRLWPPVTGVPRTLTEDAELGGIKIPKGTNVLTWSPAIQRRESVWGEDAGEFRPERFLEEPSTSTEPNPMSPSPMPKGVPDSAFTVFGGGVRPCIGRALAMIEMKLVLMHLSQRFSVVEMEPDNFEMSLEAGDTLFPDRKLKLGLKRRLQ